MKYKLYNLNKKEYIENLYFNSLEKIEKYLQNKYLKINKEIKEFSLSDTLAFLNFEIEEIPSLKEFNCRTCSECKKGMNEGFIVFGGDEYYCSNKCLNKNYSKQEWNKIYQESEETQEFSSYWTQWEISEEYDEYLDEIGESA